MLSKKLWEIPDNWCWTTISEIGEVVGGGTPSSKEPKYWGGEINWISPADLTGYSKKTIHAGKKSITKSGLKNSSAKVMPAGSVHFSSRAPIGYVVISAESLATNQGFKSLVPASGVSNEYVYYYLKGSKQLAEKQASGTTFLELSGKAFGLLPLPLPSPNEQKRIVGKIEELFSELDNGIAALKTAREQLKVYRQAVLKHAFEGKLTAKWREENVDSLETAEELLEKIKQEREKYYEQQFLDWKAQIKEWEKDEEKGKKPIKPSKPKFIDFIWSKTTVLPKGWSNVAMQAISDKITDGTHHTPTYTKDGMPFISVKDIRNSKIHFNNCKFISHEEHKQLINRCHPEEGDLLITKSGTIGRMAIVPEKEFSLFVSVALIKIQSAKKYISPDWLQYVFEYHLMGLNIDQEIKGGVIKNYHLEDLRLASLPLTCFKEQQQIVTEIEKKFSVIDQLEQDISDNLKRADVLRQSILKKAFSGQLVPQDPNDEPASELLARIKKENVTQVVGKATKKKLVREGR